MALINCPSCGHSVSSLAESCPQCGHPIAIAKSAANYSALPNGEETIVHSVSEETSQTPTKESRSNKKKTLSIVSVVIVCALAFTCVYYALRPRESIVGTWRTYLGNGVLVTEYVFTKDGDFMSYLGESVSSLTFMAHGSYEIENGQIRIDMDGIEDEEREAFEDFSIEDGKLFINGFEWERIE